MDLSRGRLIEDASWETLKLSSIHYRYFIWECLCLCLTCSVLSLAGKDYLLISNLRENLQQVWEATSNVAGLKLPPDPLKTHRFPTCFTVKWNGLPAHRKMLLYIYLSNRLIFCISVLKIMNCFSFKMLFQLSTLFYQLPDHHRKSLRRVYGG